MPEPSAPGRSGLAPPHPALVVVAAASVVLLSALWEVTGTRTKAVAPPRSTEPGKAPVPAAEPPPGTTLVTLPVPNHLSPLTPGSKVDVLGAVRVGGKFQVFPLITNVPVHAVDAVDVGRFPSANTASLAVTPKQADVLALARERGCRTEMLLRSPNKPARDHDLDAVIALLRDLPYDLVAPPPRPVAAKP